MQAELAAVTEELTWVHQQKPPLPPHHTKVSLASNPPTSPAPSPDSRVFAGVVRPRSLCWSRWRWVGGEECGKSRVSDSGYDTI
ncbi:hypothetical protein E2C01_017786 [Portunus trituberculatus]|uniref:Uncharacterized protein n=1 Tax=Portunus trituberculatus TaxID=210409 RepID=A0A5B7DUS6_PORTR|nr:hypothetical protein [Portunus trituberculatus]